MNSMFMLAGFILVLMGLDDEAELPIRVFCIVAGLITMGLVCIKENRGDDI